MNDFYFGTDFRTFTLEMQSNSSRLSKVGIRKSFENIYTQLYQNESKQLVLFTLNMSIMSYLNPQVGITGVKEDTFIKNTSYRAAVNKNDFRIVKNCLARTFCSTFSLKSDIDFYI